MRVGLSIHAQPATMLTMRSGATVPMRVGLSIHAQPATMLTMRSGTTITLRTLRALD